MSAASFVLCPGRGSYAKEELGTLSRLRDRGGEETRALLRVLEGLRADQDPDLPSLRDLDQAASFRPGLHLSGRNAAPLIFACSLLDAVLAKRETEIALVGGNSLGFYTALVVSEALDATSGYRLVSTMARLQEEGPRGGQVLWTLLDEDWNVLTEREERMHALLESLAARGLAVALSIRLGGHVVLAGDEQACRALLEELPEVVLGSRSFPFRLPMHGPFHTPLLAPVAEAARYELQDLDVGRPRVDLVDGRGYVWNRTRSEPAELLDYTLRTQVTECFDFSAVVRVGLLDYAPEELRLLGPGQSLRAPVGHVQKQFDLVPGTK